MITLNPTIGFMQLVKLLLHTRRVAVGKHVQFPIFMLKPSDLLFKARHLSHQGFNLASTSKNALSHVRHRAHALTLKDKES